MKQIKKFTDFKKLNENKDNKCISKLKEILKHLQSAELIYNELDENCGIEEDVSYFLDTFLNGDTISDLKSNIEIIEEEND